MLPSTFDPAICTQCGGLCCKGTPGVWLFPERFFQAYPELKAEAPAQLQPRLEAYELSFHWVLGTPIPAPAVTESGCAFLGAEGCRLSIELRPGQCLALRPELETVLTGEMHCRLPSGCNAHHARSSWEAYWQHHQPKETSE